MTSTTKKLLAGAAALKGLLMIATALLLIGAGCAKAPETPTAPLVGDAAFEIDGTPVRLKGDTATEVIDEGAATMTVTSVFGEPVYGDLDGDGTPDAALLLTRDAGGSGIFYYASAALLHDGAYEGLNAIPLGDRVGPQDIRIENGAILVDYADRKPGEPMTAPPTVGVTKHLRVDEGRLIEFEVP